MFRPETPRPLGDLVFRSVHRAHGTELSTAAPPSSQMRDSLKATIVDMSRCRSVTGTRTWKLIPFAVSFIRTVALRAMPTFFIAKSDLQENPLSSFSGFSAVNVFRPLSSTVSSTSCTPPAIGTVLLRFTDSDPCFVRAPTTQSMINAGTKSTSLASRTSLLCGENVASCDRHGARYASESCTLICVFGVTSHASRSAAAISRPSPSVLSGAISFSTSLHTVTFSTDFRIPGSSVSMKTHSGDSAGLHDAANTGSAAEHFSTRTVDGTVWFTAGTSAASIVAFSASSSCTRSGLPPSWAIPAEHDRCSRDSATSNSAPPPARAAAGIERSLREKLPHTVSSSVRFKPSALTFSSGTLTVTPASAAFSESNADVGSNGAGFGSPASAPTAASTADRNTARNIACASLLVLWIAIKYRNC
eukprot:Hpha_TRINITY_DN16527_c0_g4::TRINITY_DN16527_c0_g4_i2::g.135545::m.135545